MTKLIYKAFILAFMAIPSSISADQLDDSYVLGFGSCITEKREQPIWKAIEKENINVLIFPPPPKKKTINLVIIWKTNNPAIVI